MPSPPPNSYTFDPIRTAAPSWKTLGSRPIVLTRPLATVPSSRVELAAAQKNPSSKRHDRGVLDRSRERARRAGDDADRSMRPCGSSRGLPESRSRRSRVIVVIPNSGPDSGRACAGGDHQSREGEPAPTLYARPSTATREGRIRHVRLGCPPRQTPAPVAPKAASTASERRGQASLAQPPKSRSARQTHATPASGSTQRKLPL